MGTHQRDCGMILLFLCNSLPKHGSFQNFQFTPFCLFLKNTTLKSDEVHLTFWTTKKNNILNIYTVMLFRKYWVNFPQADIKQTKSLVFPRLKCCFCYYLFLQTTSTCKVNKHLFIIACINRNNSSTGLWSTKKLRKPTVGNDVTPIAFE